MQKYLALLFLAFAPCLTGCASDKNISATHDQLLLHTPIGSDGTNVLKYVVDDLKPGWASSYYAYVDALQSGRDAPLNVLRTGLSAPAIPKPSDWPPNEDWPAKAIEVTFRAHIFSGSISAIWKFDKNDKLLKLEVYETPSTPSGYN
jgi:hypothetical protein